MAAKQNRCAEMQCLLGGSSLKLAFWQVGAQRSAMCHYHDGFLLVIQVLCC
jgi:hypothetical protein